MPASSRRTSAARKQRTSVARGIRATRTIRVRVSRG